MRAADGATTSFSAVRAAVDSDLVGVDTGTTAKTTTVIASFGADTTLGFSSLRSGGSGAVSAIRGRLVCAGTASHAGSCFGATGGVTEGAATETAEPAAASGWRFAATSGWDSGFATGTISRTGGASAATGGASGSSYDQITA